MKLLDKLMNNKWVIKFLNLLQGNDKLFESVDLSFIDDLYEKSKKSRRGKKKVFKVSQIFKLVIDGFQNGKIAATQIARFTYDVLVKSKHNLPRNISHDVISDFWISLNGIIKEIFLRLVIICKNSGIIFSGDRQIVDATDIKSKFKKDSDAKWNYDATRKKYYFGYGLLLSIDPATHLPVAGFLTSSKKITTKECLNLFKDAIKMNPQVISADAEFDISELLEWCSERNIEFVVPYNKRNSKDPLPIKFRSEVYGFNQKELSVENHYRPEVEHAISTLKEHFHLLDFHVKGRDKVETHLLFVLCMRLIHGIATSKIGKNPRQVTHI